MSSPVSPSLSSRSPQSSSPPIITFLARVVEQVRRGVLALVERVGRPGSSCCPPRCSCSRSSSTTCRSSSGRSRPDAGQRHGLGVSIVTVGVRARRRRREVHAAVVHVAGDALAVDDLPAGACPSRTMLMAEPRLMPQPVSIALRLVVRRRSVTRSRPCAGCRRPGSGPSPVDVRHCAVRSGSCSSFCDARRPSSRRIDLADLARRRRRCPGRSIAMAKWLLSGAIGVQRIWTLR